ncbi:Uncharacterised protein [Mycobacteroides abscessus subsp. abscessus]|nr:Uncharacterised protein [Mycobacteroides abscessus subsp. abscessus]SHW35673.1 Uncharacterised protein [Mycobacteroides abscessus subsp. abscessus]
MTARSMNRLPAIPSNREKSRGLPIFTVTLEKCQRAVPGGFMTLVPTMATGMTGTPVASAIRASPVLPLYRRPSGERVPSG